MEYSNNKIKQLIEQRNKIVSRLDSEINREIEKEKMKYKFSWKRFLMVVGIFVIPAITIKLNHRIFSNDLIWSWNYYLK